MTVDRSEGPAGITVLRIRGEVDVVTAGSLTETVTAASVATRAVVLDLSAVTFFDSAGVRLVDRLAQACDRDGTGFRVIAPAGGRARRILDLVGLGDALACDALDEAVAALS